MARKAGRRGRVYLGLTNGAAASPITYVSGWTIDFNTDKLEVTSMDDTNKVYVAGLPDSKGTFTGFFDDATAQAYTAATDGLARNFYLYPDTSMSTQYYFGTILADFSVSTSVNDTIKFSSNWAAASPISKVG
jgi:hypothetical protein